LATALAATVVAIVDLKLWKMSTHVPLFGADGDGAFFLAAVKDVVEHGWFVSNPDLGAPFGQSSFDFAAMFGDLAHYGIVKVLALIFGDGVVVFNAFFLLCFPLIAVVAYGVLRDLGATRPVALVAGVLYAFMPYHLLRNQPHLFLSAYYAVPLAVWLVVSIVEGRTLVQRRLSRRTLTTIGVCLLVGAASDYYAVFALLVLLAVVPLAALAWRSRRMALQGGVVTGIVLASLLACHSPSIVHAIVEGPNQLVGKRTAAESELFGLKLTHLVMPRPGHRVGVMSRRATIYAQQAPMPSEGFSPSLGVVGTIGLAGAIFVLLVTGLGGREASLRRRRVAAAGATALVCFVIGTIGGVSALIAYELTPQVRGWNRLSIVIAFAALLAVALALTALFERWRARGRSPWVFGAVLAAVGIGGLLDQTSPGDAPNYASIAASWNETGNFVHAVQTRLPAGAEILQLPYMPYPESGRIWGMEDYAHMKGYLHSSRLKWSYGAMKGRPSDWHDNGEVLGPVGLATAAMIAGFSGVEVDRKGYPDKGAAATTALGQFVGAGHSVSSASGRLRFFDLRDAAARLVTKTSAAERRDISDALLYPVTFDYGSGFSYYDAENSIPFRWASTHATLRVDNTLSKLRRVRFTAGLSGGSAQPSTVTVTFPGAATQTLAVSRAGVSFGADLVVPPGGGELRLHTEGPAAPAIANDVFDRRLKVEDPRVREQALADARLAQLAAIASNH
jgi:phosphoglycerol transferase